MGKYAHDELKMNKDLVRSFALRQIETLEFAHEALKADKAFMLDLVAQDGRALQYAPDAVRKQPDMIEVAVAENATVLDCLDSELLEDVEVVSNLINKNEQVLEHVNLEMLRVLQKDFGPDSAKHSEYAQGHAALWARCDNKNSKTIGKRTLILEDPSYPPPKMRDRFVRPQWEFISECPFKPAGHVDSLWDLMVNREHYNGQ